MSDLTGDPDERPDGPSRAVAPAGAPTPIESVIAALDDRDRHAASSPGTLGGVMSTPSTIDDDAVADPTAPVSPRRSRRARTRRSDTAPNPVIDDVADPVVTNGEHRAVAPPAELPTGPVDVVTTGSMRLDEIVEPAAPAEAPAVEPSTWAPDALPDGEVTFADPAAPVVPAEPMVEADPAAPFEPVHGDPGPVANGYVDPTGQVVVATEPPPGWYLRRRARARRVRRTIRHIDPWSVFKITLPLYLCFYVAVTIAGVLLWNAAVGSGVITNIESFAEELGFEEFQLNADQIFRGFAIIGFVLAIAGAAFSVALAILFNLISDLVGGVRVTVIEDDGAIPVDPRHRT